MAILVTAEPTFLGRPRRYWWQVLQNVLAYFGVTFVALYLGPAVADLSDGVLQPETVQALFDWSVATKAAVAAGVATVGFVKSLLGGLIGNKATPSWLPAAKDPATPPPPAEALPDAA